MSDIHHLNIKTTKLYQKLCKLESRLNYDTTLLETCKAQLDELQKKLDKQLKRTETK